MSEDRERNEGHVEHVEHVEATEGDVEGHKLPGANEGHVERNEGHVERSSEEDDVEAHGLAPGLAPRTE